MTTDTATRQVQRDDVADYTTEFVALLNAKEVDRRAEVNARHLAEYGRTLYPEGGQYATFTLDKPGPRFQRVVQTTDGSPSVHCFIDRATGDVLKAAGWKAPALGARYNLLDDDSRRRLFNACEYAGGYLYAGRGEDAL